MKKITANDPLSKSLDLRAELVEILRVYMPDAFAGDTLDVEALRAILGDSEKSAERYGLTWHGKQAARRSVFSPSTATLLPLTERSAEWDVTQNVFIEGDNLEVLKLLQKSYSGKVKLIYIDPPYNTGNDFVYHDDFADTLKSYLELTEQVDVDGRTVSSNPQTSGRFHTTWLNMIYPRLLLARNLLRDDGVLIVSIDDNELANARLVLDGVFGEEQFIGTFVWKSRQNKDNRNTTGVSVDHEYALCYGRAVRGDVRDTSQYSNPDSDARGPWTSANMVGLATADRRPNLHFDLVNPKTGIKYPKPEMGWRYDPSGMAALIAEDKILWPPEKTGRPRRKKFLNELDSDFTGFSTVIGEDLFTRDGTATIDELFGFRAFDFPKPVELIRQFVEQATSNDDIVLDFFAGSGTTGHAVMAQNLADGGHRRFILVQLPEPLDDSNGAHSDRIRFCDKHDLPRNLASISEERLKRTLLAYRKEKAQLADPGFRVFCLAKSCLRAWQSGSQPIEDLITATVDRIDPTRSEHDLLFELLLKLGLSLTVPIVRKKIGKLSIVSVGGGALIACLAKSVKSTEVEALALGIIDWHRALAPAAESVVVFRDDAYASDVDKTNMTALLHQHGLTNVRSL